MILVKGYFDRNFGDDLMIRLFAERFGETLVLDCDQKELLIPFETCSNLVTRDTIGLDQTENKKNDAVLNIIGAGFQITSRTGVIYAAMATVKRLFRFGKKPFLAAVGCNIGPFRSKFAEHLVRCDLKRYDLIIVRDSASFRYCKTHIKKVPVYLLPDIVFGLPDGAIPQNSGEGCLGISAYNKRFGKNNYVFYQKMALVADDYIEKIGKTVLLFAFDTGEENDLAAAYIIRSLCHYKKAVEIVAHDDGGQNIITNFARCATIIGVRFHSLVLSLRMGIPLVPILYSAKSGDVLSDLGYDGFSMSIDAIDVAELSRRITAGIPTFTPDPSVFADAVKHTSLVKEAISKKQFNETKHPL